jgi:putative MFS transporter
MSLAITDADILAQVDTQRLGPLHVFTLCLCAIGFGFDLAELGLGNVLSAIFSAPPYNSPPGSLSWLLAAPYIGGIIGAPFYGWIADRWGRRSTLVLMMVSLGLLSVLGAQQKNIEILTIYRVLCGLTLGAFPPIVIAYMTDLLPADGRGRTVMMTCAIAILSVPLSIFFIRWLTPYKPFGVDAWRLAFVVYGFGSIVTGLAMLWAPESARWLVKMGRLDEAVAALKRLAKGVQAPTHRAQTDDLGPRDFKVSAPTVAVNSWKIAVFAAFSFFAAWATVSFPLLSGAILVQKGIKVPDALLYVGIAAIGPFVSMFASSLVIDRFGRRLTLWAMGIVMALAAAAFVLGTAPWLLVGSGLIFQIANSIFVPTTSMYLAELFSTKNRARATSSLWAVNRFGSVIAPLYMLPLLHTSGAFSLFLTIAATLTVSLLLLILMPRGRAGQAVD